MTNYFSAKKTPGASVDITTEVMPSNLSQAEDKI